MLRRCFVFEGNTFDFKIKGDDYRLKIFQDDASESPREWDNLSTMLCWHGRYNLGDTNAYANISEALYDLLFNSKHKFNASMLMQHQGDETNRDRDMRIMDLLKDEYCIKYLYLYDHSGISISTSDFKDRWDSGIVGIVYINKQDLLKVNTAADDLNWQVIASNVIEQEVKVYNQYIQGFVYSFTWTKQVTCPTCGNVTEEVEVSMGGFYGNNILKNGMLEHLPEEVAKFFEEEI